MENLSLTPRIAKNMNGMGAGISFPEMLRTPPKRKFALYKLRLAKAEDKEADVVLQKVLFRIRL